MALDSMAINCGGTSATVVPQRGALVSQLVVSGKSVLYLDRETLDDTSRNVRGGIPLLFPFAGKLKRDRLVDAGTLMERHGFGRKKSWSVVERTDHSVRLALSPDYETRAQYPFEFLAEQTITALPRGIRIELLVENIGAAPLPLSPGWHPYFCCPAELKNRVASDMGGFVPTMLQNDKEFDFGLAAPGNGRVEFSIPDMGTLSLSFSPEMRHFQFWSQPGKDFFCIEPWWGPANTINTERRALVAHQECKAFWMRIEVDTQIGNG